jgi:hypothetical protein
LKLRRYLKLRNSIDANIGGYFVQIINLAASQEASLLHACLNAGSQLRGVLMENHQINTFKFELRMKNVLEASIDPLSELVQYCHKEFVTGGKAELKAA